MKIEHLVYSKRAAFIRQTIISAVGACVLAGLLVADLGADGFNRADTEVARPTTLSEAIIKPPLRFPVEK